jgi:hypothetical protein
MPSQHLDLACLADGIVTFKPSEELTSGYDQRAIEAMRIVRKSFRKAGCSADQHPDHVTITATGLTSEDLAGACLAVEGKLEALRLKPLSSRAVEMVLSISSAERRRWSKDGRLPHIGNALVKIGKKQLSLFVYSPATIQAIASAPSRITQWREQDIGNASLPATDVA